MKTKHTNRKNVFSSYISDKELICKKYKELLYVIILYLNYAKLANIEQEEKKTPSKFPDLKKPFTDALRLIPKVKREEGS